MGCVSAYIRNTKLVSLDKIVVIDSYFMYVYDFFQSYRSALFWHSSFCESFKMRTFASNEYSDKMPHNAAFHQDLHRLPRQKGS